MPSPCTVTANLKTILSGNSSLATVTFTLSNIGTGNVARVLNTGIFPALTVIATSDINGSVSTSLWGNDNIDPSGTLYNVTFRDQNRNEVGPILFSIVGANFNLNSAAHS